MPEKERNHLAGNCGGSDHVNGKQMIQSSWGDFCISTVNRGANTVDND